MKTKKTRAISRAKRVYQNALCDLILTRFNKDIKYDYQIPPVKTIQGIVSKSLEQWCTKSHLKKDISEIIFDNDKTNSILRNHLWIKHIFGNENIGGYGILFRYRKEKKANALFTIYNTLQLSNCKIIDGKVKHLSLKIDVQKFIMILKNMIGEY